MKRIIIYSLLMAASSASIASAQDRGPRRNGGAAGGFTGTPEQPTNSTPRAKELAAAYQNLLNTSIFARDRRSGAQRPEVTQVDPPPSSENFLAFRGVAEEDGQMTAFIEDTRDNSPIRVHVGEPLANGKVSAMTPSELVYESKDGLRKMHVPLGNNLAGREMEAPQVATSDTPASATPASSLQDLQNFFQQRRTRGGGFGGGPGGGFGGTNGGGGGRGNGGQFGTGGGFDPTQQRRQRGGGGFDPNATGGGGGFDPNAAGGGGGGRRRQRGGGGGQNGQDSGFGG
jgi:hypothetical protein